MEIYNIDVYTDLNEYLTLTIQVNDPREAEAIAQTMIVDSTSSPTKNGEVNCVGQIAVSCSAYSG